MIDNGFCFGGQNWRFNDVSAGRGNLHFNREVYSGVRGLCSFDPWLNVLENRMTMDKILSAASDIPREWFDNDTSALVLLLNGLYERRFKVREYLLKVRDYKPEIFPHWERSHPQNSQMDQQPSCHDGANGHSAKQASL
jgi:hypothetical protein